MNKRLTSLFLLATIFGSSTLALSANAQEFRLSRPSNHMQTGGVDYQEETTPQPSPPMSPMQSGAMDSTSLRSGMTQTNLQGGATDGGGLRPPLAASAAIGNFPRKLFNMGTRQLDANELSTLGKHDVVILIDKSSSMSEEDCPSVERPGYMISRWNWCFEQTMDLARQTASVLPQGISVLLFSWGTRVFPHVDMRDIPRIFAENKPDGITNEGTAIQTALDDYFQRKHAAHGKVAPLLIAVITDGRPTGEENVRRAIIETTHRMQSPDEIRINFLLIGQDTKGLKFIQEMDNGLIAQGAKYDIVSSKPFPTLMGIGLAKALVDGVNTEQNPLLNALSAFNANNNSKHKKHL
jgi:hypothetical protein